jgi:hypothetical protein
MDYSNNLWKLRSNYRMKSIWIISLKMTEMYWLPTSKNYNYKSKICSFKLQNRLLY